MAQKALLQIAQLGTGRHHNSICAIRHELYGDFSFIRRWGGHGGPPLQFVRQRQCLYDCVPSCSFATFRIPIVANVSDETTC